MKILNKWGLFAATIVLFAGCKKSLDINRDPNNFTDVPVNLLLPTAQVQLAYTLGGELSRITGNFTQHYAGHRNQPLLRAPAGRAAQAQPGVRVSELQPD